MFFAVGQVVPVDFQLSGRKHPIDSRDNNRLLFFIVFSLFQIAFVDDNFVLIFDEERQFRHPSTPC